MNLIEHLTAAGKIAASLNPIGSAIVQAIDEYVPSAHDKANKLAAEKIARRLDELSERIEVERVSTDEFADLFKSCAAVCGRTQHEEKLRAAANILGNALLRNDDADKLTYAELDHFIRNIEQLSLGAIHVLKKCMVRGSYPGVGRHASEVHKRNVRFDFDLLAGDCPDFSRDLLMGLLGELHSVGLIHLAGVPGVGFGDENRKYDNYPVETTPLGFRFQKYVLDPNSRTHHAQPHNDCRPPMS